MYWDKTLKLYDLKPTELNAVRKALLVAQRFKCAVCGRFLGGGKIAFLDHAHGSGELRGMLCFHCNRFRVAKNTRDTAEEVVRYLADPPAAKELPAILRRVKEGDSAT
jgi:hypothetical protein